MRSHRRMILRLLLAVSIALTGLVLGLGAPVASADLCKDAPRPIEPKSGLPGLLIAKPSNNDIPDQAPDPFAEGSDVAIGDVYGYHWTWANYDLGCGNDFLRDPVAVTNTATANPILGGIGAGIALLDSLESAAKDSPLNWAIQLVGQVQETLNPILLGGEGKIGWLPLAAVALGLLLAWQARKADYASTFRTLLVFAGAASLAVWALVYPYTAAKAADDTVRSVASIAGQSFSASMADTVNREAGYKTWLAGNFGTAEGDLVDDLGPRLLSATHYTWSDMERMEADPDAKKSIDQAKATEFKAVADELQDRNPSAYEHFTGRADRGGPVGFGVVVFLCTSLFAFAAAGAVLLGRVMMLALVIAAPVAAVAGILPPGFVVVQKMWGLFTAAVWAVAKFTLGGGVMALVLGGLASSTDLDPGLKLLAILVATVVGLALLKPLRTFKTMTPGLDPNRSYLKEAVGGLLAMKGIQAIDNVNDDAESRRKARDSDGEDQGESNSSSSTRRAASYTTAMEPLPPLLQEEQPSATPTWVQVPTQEPTPPDTQQQRWGGVLDTEAQPARALPAAPARALSQVPEDSLPQAAARALPPGQQPVDPPQRAAIAGAAADAPPPTARPSWEAVEPSTWTSEHGATALPAAAQPAASFVIDPTHPSVTSGPVSVGGASNAGEELTGGPTTANATPSSHQPAAGHEAVVHPTGIIVQDPTMYAGSTAAPPERYVRLNEPELDADTGEVVEEGVRYRSTHAAEASA